MEYEVEMVCRVRKIVTVECDSEEEARGNPFDHAVSEYEVDQMDWDVVNVKEIK